MKIGIDNPKDFWLGAVYLLAGAAALYLGADYPLGRPGRMGPGYFPTVIASVLILFGIVSIIRSLVTTGATIRIGAMKPLLLITGGLVAFGLLLDPLGLVVAMTLLILMSAAASEHFRFQWRAAAGVVALVAFCAVVFVKALGVPMPLTGAWLAPFVPPWLGG
ncbi:MAG TPA: tripartite tricarboxylate transporter TctB family protein [Beijerinckiaceae bacterium]